jgi:hypothetical protein
MNSKNQIFDLLSLLKVFDINYISEGEADALCNLDANHQEDVLEAVKIFLIPEFQSYLSTSQSRLNDLLRRSLNNPAEDFEELFDRVELAFESPIADRREFMKNLLTGLDEFMGT